MKGRQEAAHRSYRIYRAHGSAGKVMGKLDFQWLLKPQATFHPAARVINILFGLWHFGSTVIPIQIINSRCQLLAKLGAMRFKSAKYSTYQCPFLSRNALTITSRIKAGYIIAFRKIHKTDNSIICTHPDLHNSPVCMQTHTDPHTHAQCSTHNNYSLLVKAIVGTLHLSPMI